MRVTFGSDRLTLLKYNIKLFCSYSLIHSSAHHEILCYISYAAVKVSLKNTNRTQPLKLQWTGWTSDPRVQSDLLSYLNTIFHALIVKDYHYTKYIFKYTGIRHLSFGWPYLVIMTNVIYVTHPPKS